MATPEDKANDYREWTGEACGNSGQKACFSMMITETEDEDGPAKC